MIWNEIKLRARYAAVPVLVASMMLYFAYHAFVGNYSIPEHERLTRELGGLEKQAAQVHQQRKYLERRVSLLRPDNLDPDLLAEEAHKVLGYTGPNDVIVLTPDKSARHNGK